MNAEQLIDQLLEGRGGKLVKGKVLSGAEVAALSPKQGILVNGKRCVVIDVNKKGNIIELVYSKGVRKFSKDLFLEVRITDKTTPVQAYTKEDPKGRDIWIYRREPAMATEAITRGMKNAYSKRENKMTCLACGMPVPRYPGRYPNKCTECGAEFECKE